MATIRKVENSILSIKSQVGTMASGKPKYKSYSYTNVSTNATDEDMLFVAERLSTLFQDNVAKISRQDICDLFKEEI